ncbi:hypothetical protein [Clostridium butyricum]|uniref:hypothetical protein n=1 Tax=Clostridium butyricum TaxID=1492 RepID=UPI002ABD8EF3|nr:hypothetical protein [Clostridium butyricum]
MVYLESSLAISMSVKCIINVSHNGKLYSIGDTISDITSTDAEKLIECGAVLKIDNKFKKSYRDVQQILKNKFKKDKRFIEELQYAKF